MAKVIKKFRNTDSSYNDDEARVDTKNYVDKYKEKRVERALRTKDISALVEEDEDEDSWWDEDKYR
jgi:hypothetical protein